jgi:hypothetical protein
MEHECFDYPLPDYSEAIRNLRSYIFEVNRLNKFRIDR